MPAYFNLSVQFRRDELYPTSVKDFYALLDEAGMKFQSAIGRDHRMEPTEAGRGF